MIESLSAPANAVKQQPRLLMAFSPHPLLAARVGTSADVGPLMYVRPTDTVDQSTAPLSLIGPEPPRYSLKGLESDSFEAKAQYANALHVVPQALFHFQQPVHAKQAHAHLHSIEHLILILIGIEFDPHDVMNPPEQLKVPHEFDSIISKLDDPTHDQCVLTQSLTVVKASKKSRITSASCTPKHQNHSMKASLRLVNP
jgi:hypothetical protein